MSVVDGDSEIIQTNNLLSFLYGFTFVAIVVVIINERDHNNNLCLVYYMAASCANTHSTI